MIATVTALTTAGLVSAVEELARGDADLAAIVARYGPPPLWDREPGFGTLLHIILEQQVSLASARSAFDRLRAVADPLTPTRFLELTDAELLTIGFSRQKARYGRALATAIETGSLDLDGLGGLDDDAVRRTLEALPGIGPWTSTIYLLMVLGRPDVWPAGDIALAESVGRGQAARSPARRDRDGDARRGLAPVAVGRRAAVLARLPGASRPNRLNGRARAVPAVR